MWNKPVAIVVIRPTRYTFEFVEARKNFSLSFFGGEYKKALGIFGSKSGRDCDKVAESGLTAFFTEFGISVEGRSIVPALTGVDRFAMGL